MGGPPTEHLGLVGCVPHTLRTICRPWVRLSQVTCIPELLQSGTCTLTQPPQSIADIQGPFVLPASCSGLCIALGAPQCVHNTDYCKRSSLKGCVRHHTIVWDLVSYCMPTPRTHGCLCPILLCPPTCSVQADPHCRASSGALCLLCGSKHQAGPQHQPAIRCLPDSCYCHSPECTLHSGASPQR